MNLYEAIFVRKSVRKYNMKAMDESILEDILNYSKSLPMLNKQLSVEYRIVDMSNEEVQLGGLFSLKAPYYLCLFSTKEENYGMNAGNLIQHISLYLTSKGIASCILGMTKAKKGNLEVENHEHVITLAFGSPLKEMYRSKEQAKRVEMEEIVIYKEKVRRNMISLMESVWLAPSSMNSQPWKFIVYDNRIHMFTKKQLFQTKGMKLLNEVDMGCALAHFLVAADELWVDCSVQYLDNISAKTFHKYEYATSIKIL